MPYGGAKVTINSGKRNLRPIFLSFTAFGTVGFVIVAILTLQLLVSKVAQNHPQRVLAGRYAAPAESDAERFYCVKRSPILFAAAALRLLPLRTQCGGFGKTHSVLWREFIVIPEKIAAAIHICGITPRVFNGNYIRGRVFRGRSAVFFRRKVVTLSELCADACA